MKSPLLAGLAMAMAMALSSPMAGVLPSEPKTVQVRPNTVPRPRLRATGGSTVPHFYGCQCRFPQARKLIRKHGIQKAMALFPRLENVKVIDVPIRRVERIDQNRYTGSDLREIRARNGVGRPPHG